MPEKEFTVITCPVCGQEFVPSEIFYPDDIIGHPTEIVKTTSGKIDFFFGPGPDLTETYVCDNCGTKLQVTANVFYKVKAVENEMDKEYVTTFNKSNKYNLEEGSLFD